MLDIDADQFGASERAGEAEQDEGAVTQPRQIGATDRDKPLDVGRGQGSRASGRLAVPARDPTERFPDSRMLCVEGMPGDPMRAGNGGDPAARVGSAYPKPAAAR